MFRLALRNCARRRLRSLLTMLGVAIGISVVVALMAVADGSENQFDRAMRTQRGDIVLMLRGARLFGQMTPAQLDAVRAVDGVARVLPYTIGTVEASTPQRPLADGAIRLQLLGFADPDAIAAKFPLEPVGTARAPAAGADEVAVGVVAAHALDVQVGGTVSLRDRAYRVVALFRTGVPWQDRGLLLHFDAASALLNLGANTRLAAADVTAGVTPPIVAARINQAVPTVEAIAATEMVDAWEEQRILKGLLWAISCIAFLAGGIGVLNTMSMAVLERTREIGLLIAIGWRAGQVRWLILWEGTLLALLGGVGGWFLGILWVHAAGWMAPEFAVAAAFGTGLFATALAMALAMGLLGGLIPAWAASRLDPVEALRFE